MKINGKFKTANGRVHDFEFKTEFLGRLYGHVGTQFDDSFSIESTITIGDSTIGTNYCNFVNNDKFKEMFKDAKLVDYQVEYDDNDIEIIGENAIDIMTEDPEMEQWYKSYYGELNPYGIGMEYANLVDEYFYCIVDFHDLLKCAYEFSNNYHFLSQRNTILESLFELIYSDFEERNLF